MVGWFGIALKIIGAWQLAHKHKYAFILMIVGGLIWMEEGLRLGNTQLFVLEFIMLVITARNYLVWAREGNDEDI